MDMSFGSGPLRILTMSVLLAIALGGCTTSLPEKQYTNTGYDDENYDLRLCWKKFVLRRATDNRPMPREKYRPVPAWDGSGCRASGRKCW